ncbi:hypothetical protein T05_14340 [Trichinella murrelli]|uniref:Uncharacterized protein n=1 Tax=Trichinella murrelli TaxID=144512 RepID=A0A0V0TVN2_9BILA|nr:hypothetical protein T05_14340 [Trichinella murrelli]
MYLLLLLLHLIALESFLSDKFASDLSRWLACRMLCFSWCFVHLVSPLMRFAYGRRLARFSSCSVGSAFYEQMQKSNWDFTTPDASKFECGSHLPVSPRPPVVPHVVSLLYELLFRPKDEMGDLLLFCSCFSQASFLIWKIEDKFRTSISRVNWWW